MKPGRRALGIAESYRGTDETGAKSTLAGAVVRADRVVDDFVFSTCTVGGHDATDTVIELWELLDRPDIQYIFVAGVALAWYNILDLEAVQEATDRPVIAVSFEDSEGLTDAIDAAFGGTERERRLDTYESLPDRRRLPLDGSELFVQSLDIDHRMAADVLERYSHDGRPEPLRVAKRAARRVDSFRRRERSQRD